MFKNAFVILGIMSTLVLASCTEQAVPGPFDGTVTNVHDGDTITVVAGNQKYKVRLGRIDAPEVDQEFGPEAGEKLRELCEGKVVHVVPLAMDLHRRVVAEVIFGGVNVNQSMVQSGYAWWYRDFDKTDRAMQLLETQARLSRAGLWQGKDPEAPWIFRRKQKEQSVQPRFIAAAVILCILIGSCVWFLLRKRNLRRLFIALLVMTLAATVAWNFVLHPKQSGRVHKWRLPISIELDPTK
jgi:endonuclease YncB( thermonuclease family)